MAKSNASYSDIYYYVFNKYGIKVGGNEIAEAKEKAGLKPRMAHNRINPDKRSTYSPQKSIDYIQEALKYFGMI